MVEQLTSPRVSLNDARTGKRVRVSAPAPGTALVPVPCPGTFWAIATRPGT